MPAPPRTDSSTHYREDRVALPWICLGLTVSGCIFHIVSLLCMELVPELQLVGPGDDLTVALWFAWYVNAVADFLSVSSFAGAILGAVCLVRVSRYRRLIGVCTLVCVFNSLVVVLFILMAANGGGPFFPEWEALGLPYRMDATPDFFESGPWRYPK